MRRVGVGRAGEGGVEKKTQKEIKFPPQIHRCAALKET